MAYYGPQGQPPQQPTRSSSKLPCVIGAVVGGCGCLLVIAAVLAVYLGAAGGLWFWPTAPSVERIEQPPVAIEQPPEAELPDVSPPLSGSPETGPSAAAAIDWAQRRYPQMDVAVESISEDGTQVHLTIGPPGVGPTTRVQARWDAASKAYVLVAESPIRRPGGSTGSAVRPGKAAAEEAALRAINQPGWVTRVQEHSGDWRRVTIWAGPPQSEWVYEVTLEWDDGSGRYVLQMVSEVPYP